MEAKADSVDDTKAVLSHLLQRIAAGEPKADGVDDPKIALVRELSNEMQRAVMRDIVDEDGVIVDEHSLIRVCMLFKLGQSVLKNDRDIMRTLQAGLREALAVVTNKLWPVVGSVSRMSYRRPRRATPMMLRLFEIGKEGRYIDDKGQIAGEPLIEGQTFLSWAIDRESMDVVEALFLAGASTKGLERHLRVKELIAKHSSFNGKHEQRASTVVGTLLQIMPSMSNAAELMAMYAQPALPVGSFGVDEDAIKASLRLLKDYIDTRRKCIRTETSADRKRVEDAEKTLQGLVAKERLDLEGATFRRAKEEQGFNMLYRIVKAKTLLEIRESMKGYLNVIEVNTIEDYIKMDEEADFVRDIFKELHRYIAHLNYGAVSPVFENDGAPPKNVGGRAPMSGRG